MRGRVQRAGGRPAAHGIALDGGGCRAGGIGHGGGPGPGWVRVTYLCRGGGFRARGRARDRQVGAAFAVVLRGGPGLSLAGVGSDAVRGGATAGHHSRPRRSVFLGRRPGGGRRPGPGWPRPRRSVFLAPDCSSSGPARASACSSLPSAPLLARPAHASAPGVCGEQRSGILGVKAGAAASPPCSRSTVRLAPDRRPVRPPEPPLRRRQREPVAAGQRLPGLSSG